MRDLLEALSRPFRGWGCLFPALCTLFLAAVGAYRVLQGVWWVIQHVHVQVVVR